MSCASARRACASARWARLDLTEFKVGLEMLRDVAKVLHRVGKIERALPSDAAIEVITAELGRPSESKRALLSTRSPKWRSSSAREEARRRIIEGRRAQLGQRARKGKVVEARH